MHKSTASMSTHVPNMSFAMSRDVTFVAVALQKKKKRPSTLRDGSGPSLGIRQTHSASTFVNAISNNMTAASQKALDRAVHGWQDCPPTAPNQPPSCSLGRAQTLFLKGSATARVLPNQPSWTKCPGTDQRHAAKMNSATHSSATFHVETRPQVERTATSRPSCDQRPSASAL